MNTDLGVGHELDALVAKIRKFDYDNATVGDCLSLARALKVLADDLCDRHEKALTVQRKLMHEKSINDVMSEISSVCKTIAPLNNRKKLLW